MRLVTKTLQLAIDNTELSKIVESQLSKRVVDENIDTNGFLNFVSQSRDWAFDYIESTQEQIHNFIQKVGPVVDYLEDYSPPILIQEHKDIIVEGYNNIRSLLPEDYGKLNT